MQSLTNKRPLRFVISSALAGLSLGSAAPAQQPAAIQYTIRIPAPDPRLAEVSASIPTGGTPSVDLMMAVWSAGYYVQEDYATKVSNFAAHKPDGRTLQPHGLSRWVGYSAGRTQIAVKCNHIDPDITGPTCAGS